MAVIIQLRGDTSGNWTASNPILAERELSLETDTWFYKIGDGLTSWNSLPYRYLKNSDESDVINFNDQSIFPTVPNSDTLNLFARHLGGRMMLRQQGPSGLSTPLQPSFFQNNIVIINTNNGTSVSSIGNTVTSVGTLSHPDRSDEYGFMTNFATAATSQATAGTGNNATLWSRQGGFFFNARLSFPDDSYPLFDISTGAATRIFVGLTSGSLAASVASDNPGGHFVGFFREHSNGSINGVPFENRWFFFTGNDSGAGGIMRYDTGFNLIAEKVYDFYIFCEPGGTEISWRIDNVTDGTMAEGSTDGTVSKFRTGVVVISNTSLLPGIGTRMRAGFQLQTVNAVSRNIRMQRVYTESDR
jgi:hypothetical protein